jgi:hypothetical protein
MGLKFASASGEPDVSKSCNQCYGNDAAIANPKRGGVGWGKIEQCDLQQLRTYSSNLIAFVAHPHPRRERHRSASNPRSIQNSYSINGTAIVLGLIAQAVIQSHAEPHQRQIK